RFPIYRGSMQSFARGGAAALTLVLAVAVALAVPACGEPPASDAIDGGVPPKQIGAACDRDNQAAWADQCPGGLDAVCEALDSCGAGFCSQRCETTPCPAGSECLALPQIDPTSGGIKEIKRCFLPCGQPGDTCPGGALLCDPGRDVCGSETLFS